MNKQALKQPKRTLRTAFFLAIAFWAVAGFYPQSGAREAMESIRAELGPNDAVLVSNPCGDILFAHNIDKRLVPASSLKVLTALVAMHHLGSSYRFPTEFYLNSRNDLLIKGYGDPLLISEAVETIARNLSSRLEQVRHIILDDSYYSCPLRIPGTAAGTRQPYNAPNGALCVNFNTVCFKIEHGEIQSAEPQTPLLPIALSRIRAKKPPASGRILLSDYPGDALRYAGELFSYFLNQAGLKRKGEIRRGRVESQDARLIYRHLGKADLSEIIAALFEYSNNYVANQLLLATGASVYGPPATLDKGVRAMVGYCRRKLCLEDIQIVEGSGISRKNRVSAKMFARILGEFKPYYDLMPRTGRLYTKTGTLDGIRTRVGYIQSEAEGLFPYTIFLNTPGKKAAPILAEIEARIP